MSSAISRRDAGRIALLSMGLGLPGPASAAVPKAAVQYGRFTAAAAGTAVFYDLLEPAADMGRPPIVMIHGGSHTGACYLSTADGRPGWAHYFAARGHRVLVPDWPGVGRSGGVSSDALDGALVTAGLADVLAEAGGPCVLMTHSMGGAFGWKLLETHGAAIRKLVALAPAPPGNIQPPAEVLERGDDHIVVRQPAGPITLQLGVAFQPPEAWVDRKLIGSGTQFPMDRRAAYIASLQPVAPKLVLERMNVDSSQLRVARSARFARTPVLVVIGANDLDHTEAGDRPIVDWLQARGADAALLKLADRGIIGNGHMMMIERNSDEIAAAIAAWIDL